MDLTPTTLEGKRVRLVPQEESQAAALWPASQGSEAWRWMPFAIRSEDDLRAFLAGARAINASGGGLGFAIESRDGGELVGMTGYWNVDHAHRRVEIGATWVARSHQRTAVNSEAKYLLLRHAFERLDCIRVEFKTDALNTRSRAALKRIGATEEGALRHHMVMPDGRLRDSVYFSILAGEWPGVRERLEGFLAR